MQVLKQFALVAALTIAAVFLIVWSLDSFGFRSPFFAFLANWLAMSWVAIAGQAIRFSLPSGYHEIKSFERTGQVYERLGIRFYKSLLRSGPLTLFSPTLRLPKEKTVSALRLLDLEMRKAETGHVIIFVVVLSFICFALVRRWFDAAGWLLLFNVIINGYPIMLQRYNRIKLQELIQAQSA